LSLLKRRNEYMLRMKTTAMMMTRKREFMILD